MNKFLTLLAAVGLLASTGSAVLADESCETAACCATKKKAATASLKIKGIEGEACAQKVEAALLKVKGVQSAHVCPVSHTAQVEFDSKATSERKISAAVRKAGYKVDKKAKS